MTGGRIRGRSFSGRRLQGYDVVRLVFLDEAGISNLKDEPHLVVAGVIVEPDRQYLELEAYLAQMSLDWVPPDKQEEFVCFHAYELFNGGKVYQRPQWGIEQTMPIIKRLLRMPVRFDLPVVYGICNRQGKVANAPGLKTPADRLEAAYQWAFMIALIRVNSWMRQHARPEELAMVIVEDNDQMRTALKRTQFWLQYPDKIAPELVRHIPLEKIIESILFAKKDESSILQIADMCAYVIKRAAGKKKHAGWMAGTLKYKIRWTPNSIEDPLPPIIKGLRAGGPFRFTNPRAWQEREPVKFS